MVTKILGMVSLPNLYRFLSLLIVNIVINEDRFQKIKNHKKIA